MEPISFTCTHCERRLKVPAEYAGEVVKCPRCLERTEVPGPDAAGSYALAGDSTSPEANPKARAPVDIWRAFGYEALSAKSKARLEDARESAAEGEWERAASVLNKLFRSSGGWRDDA